MKKICLILVLCAIVFITGCEKKDTVVIYTAMEEERIQELKKQVKEDLTGINVVVESVGTGNLAAKVKTEKENIEADIIVDLETAHMENLKDNFADLSNFDDSMYLEGVNPEHNKYFTWVKSYSGITIDNDYFKEHNLDIPKTYEDLLKDEYKGLIAMPDPTTSGTGYTYYLNVYNLYGIDGTLTYFDKLSKNIKQFTASGSGPISLLKQKEIAIAMGMAFQGVAEINNGANYSLIELETGSPYTTTSIGIIKGRETDENVIKVFNWLVSDFGKYDKENFIPGKVLKEQENKIKNWPDYLTDANVNGVNDIEIKENLISKWDR